MSYKIPQGKLNSDKSYQWQCDHHDQKYSPNNCPYCLDLNLSKIVRSLEVSKGQIYFGNLKAFLSLKGKEIYDEAITIRNSKNKFTIPDLMEVVDKFLPYRTRSKIIIEWLEETDFLPVGTYDRIKRSNFQPTKYTKTN